MQSAADRLTSVQIRALALFFFLGMSNQSKRKSKICAMRPNLRFGATKIEDFRMPKIQRIFEHLKIRDF